MASFLKQEPGVEQPRIDLMPEPLGPLRRSSNPSPASQDRERDGNALKHTPQLRPLCVSSPPRQQAEQLEEVREEEREGGPIKMEVSSYSCQAAYPLPLSLTEAEAKPEVIKDPERYPSCTTAGSDGQESAEICVSREETASAECKQQQPDLPINLHSPSRREIASEPPVCAPPTSDSPLPLVTGHEDPMAGMIALLTASEMAQARPSTPPAPTLLPQIENSLVSPNCSGAGALEMVALEGMALLSQMAQQEMENISLDQGE